MGIKLFTGNDRFVLEEATLHYWHKQIIKRKNLERIFSKRFKPLMKHRHNLLTTYKRIDARYKNLSREADKFFYDNYQTFMQKLKYFIDSILEEKNPLAVDEHQQLLLEKLNEFEEVSRKNIPVLKSHLEKEISKIKSLLKMIEDDLVNIAKAVGEYDIDKIVEIKATAYEILKAKMKIAKYAREKKTLQSEYAELEKKKNAVQQRVKHNKDRIRNKVLIGIVEDVSKIEREKRNLLSKYRKLAFEIKRFYTKNNLSLSQGMKNILSSITRNAEDAVLRNAEAVRSTLSKFASQIEDELKKDISNAEKNILTDSKKLRQYLDSLRNLKKEIIKDVNALNIYEQNQILKTVIDEMQDIKLKIESIDREINELGIKELKRKIEKQLEPFGAVARWKNS